MRPGRMRGGETGAVLAILVVLSGVLAILSAAVFVLFQTNASSWRYRDGRVRAQLAAEAGVSLALHTLEQESSAPSGQPYSMPGDSSQWMTLPWGDRVWVVIDPSDTGGSCAIGSVEIRSRGISRNVTRDVVVRAAPDFPSRYALLTDMGIPPGTLGDGTHMGGPVHSNGSIFLDSTSPDSTGDPWVESISTTAGGGFQFCDTGPGTEPHPEGSRVWMRPYPRLRQGRPYWDPSADSISFSRLESFFAGLQSSVGQGGSVLWGTRRILLDGDMLISRTDPMSPADTVSLRGTSLVFVAGYSQVLIKSRSPLTEPLTIVSTGPIGFMGPLAGGSAYCGTPLGIVSLSGFTIARDPDFHGGEDWPPPWDIRTDAHFSVSAFLCAPDGSISAEDPTAGGGSYSFNILGGLAVSRLGTMCSGTRGYDMVIAYDETLSSSHPPFFPSLEHWKMFSWMIDPDYDDGHIDDDMY